MSIGGDEGQGPRAEGRGETEPAQGGAERPSLGPRPLALGPVKKRRYAAAAFITLLILSVVWPSPVVSANRLWINTDLDVDHLSFLGREAPSWDVVFWCVAGILLLAMMQSADSADFREPLRHFRDIRFTGALFRSALVRLLAGAILTLVVWWSLDTPLLRWAEAVQSDATRNAIRLVNRLGGGMNPVLIVAFFLVAGVAYAERRWVSYAVSMSIAGVTAGLVVQLVKLCVGRARPELWLGAAQYAPGSSTSFPSGHTVGAFALAGVLVFASRSPALRVIAFLLASAVGFSRVLAFRHWASDVTASAVIGLVAAWLCVRASTVTRA